MFLHGKESPVELRSTADSDNQRALQDGGGKGQVPCLRIEINAQESAKNDSSNSVQWLYESDDIIAYIRQHKLAK